MSIEKPSLPSGTRDFGAATMIRRNFIFDTIKATFKRFGFTPLETPAMEKLSVLTGKYGDEGDQLIFKVLNSGDFLKDVQADDLAKGYKPLTRKVSEKALRYDLTVPFARYVVMNRNDISFPFKRYQIQPVWRADRPQKGRYREFYQCDADVVGTDSLICEAEIVLMMHEVLHNLGIKSFQIKINNRKILAGLAEAIGAAGREAELCVAIDKLDKIGQQAVEKELLERGFSAEAIEKLAPIFSVQGDNTALLTQIKTFLESSEQGQKGLEELNAVFDYLAQFGYDASAHVAFDVTLARGLSYYTGAIFEVKALGVSIGSISGGGRYDNLTGMFGLPNVSGVGFSFGVDRIYDVMEELQLFPASQTTTTQVLISNFDAQAEKYALPLLAKIRAAGICAELFPESSKLKKQMTYANNKQIPFVLLIGSNEMETGLLTLKNMTSGEQQNLAIDQVIEQLKA